MVCIPYWILSSFLGVYFYYQKRKDGINEKQKIFRNRAMYVFLTIAIICVGYSWI